MTRKNKGERGLAVPVSPVPVVTRDPPSYNETRLEISDRAKVQRGPNVARVSGVSNGARVGVGRNPSNPLRQASAHTF